MTLLSRSAQRRGSGARDCEWRCMAGSFFGSHSGFPFFFTIGTVPERGEASRAPLRSAVRAAAATDLSPSAHAADLDQACELPYSGIGGSNALCRQAGGGRASARIGAGRDSASGFCARRGRPARLLPHVRGRFRQRPTHIPAESLAHRVALRISSRASCLTGLARLAPAVRAALVDRAPLPARRVLRYGQVVDDPLRVSRGWRRDLRCWPRSAPGHCGKCRL